MKDNWIFIVLGVVVAVVIIALIGFSMMNNDMETNTMGNLNNANNTTNERGIADNINNTGNTNNTNNNNTNNSLMDNRDNEGMLDKTEFNNLKNEAEKIARDIGNNVGNFTQDAIDAFNKARNDLMTYDQEESQSQEEIDRRSKNLREAIDNLNMNNNTNTTNNTNNR